MKHLALLSLAVLLSACGQGCSSKKTGDASPSTTRETSPASEVVWETAFDSAVFERAQRDGRLVLLDLGAVWCHWCHVMEETTYADAEVKDLLAENFVCIKIDQDQRPDLANRYEDYGWPATIFFDSKGTELVKWRGYIPPERMRAMLRAIIADPTPGPSAIEEPIPTSNAEGTLSREVHDRLLAAHSDFFDEVHGGFGFVHKYLHQPSTEYCLVRAAEGDERSRAMAKKTFDGELNLLDPVWGGFYQYSHGGVWSNPHFEKIMSMQAENIRLYAMASQLFDEPRYLEAAKATARYLELFLTSPDGTFYTAQDADLVAGEHGGEYFSLDDAGRRARGIPRVDRHVYSRENGWAIHALTSLYAVTRDGTWLDRAKRAAVWIDAHRRIAEGGYRHDEVDAAGPYLADSLAMARAHLGLYEVTAERRHLDLAIETADFIRRTFAAQDDAAGFLTASAAPADPTFTPRPQRDENITAARLFRRLHAHTNQPRFAEAASIAARHLFAEAIAMERPTGGILLVADELARPPIHVTIVGAKSDARARGLFDELLGRDDVVVEWWDRTEGPSAHAGTEYPRLNETAAFVCDDRSCSAPATDPIALEATIAAAKRR